MDPLISIQILNWNRAEETLRAIKSALAQSYLNTEIVVVDNGSTDNSVELIRANYSQVKLIELDKNYGCPEGRNQGIKYCNGTFIFYLDNDGILHKDAVKNAYKLFSTNIDIGIVTGVVYDFEFENQIDEKCIPYSDKKYKYWEFQGGICMHKKEIYDVIGNYPSHFVYGGEELYLALKILGTNYIIYKDETVILWHRKSNLARNRSEEQIRGYFNKLYIAVSLYPTLYALKFFSYFILVYPIYAIRDKVFVKFLKKFKTDFGNTLRKALRNRSPINKSDYLAYLTFKK